MTVKEARIKLKQCERKIEEYEQKEQQMKPTFLHDYQDVEIITNTLENEIIQRNMLIDFIKGGDTDDI